MGTRIGRNGKKESYIVGYKGEVSSVKNISLKNYINTLGSKAKKTGIKRTYKGND